MLCHVIIINTFKVYIYITYLNAYLQITKYVFVVKNIGILRRLKLNVTYMDFNLFAISVHLAKK